MPGRDGTGPIGQGAMTGGGFGDCMMSERSYQLNRRRASFYGRGKGFGKGSGVCRSFRNRFFDQGFRRFTDETIFDEKEYLESELKSIEIEVSAIKDKLQKLTQSS